MKKTEMIVLATMAVVFIGLGSLAWGGGEPKDIVNGGITVIHDETEDFLGDAPDYADIENARISEVGKNRIDMSITPAGAIPAEPEEAYIQYYWQFPGVCDDGSPTDKYGMVATWTGPEEPEETGIWSANWIETDCITHETWKGASADSISFEEGGVRVRASLDDFWAEGVEDGELYWFAGVRLAPNELPVDVVPEVYNNPPEIFATWMNR